MDPHLVAVVVGILQGVFEWLPISSEGNVALALSLIGRAPDESVAFALFLHLGTAVSATLYYRERLWTLTRALPDWRPGRAFDAGDATGEESDAPVAEVPELSFLAVATLVSGVVGIAAYQTLEAIVSALTGGLFVALVGVLLVVTGAFQRLSSAVSLGARSTPTLVDAVLVGVGQGLAILPGISRSGTTAGLLLLRGYDGPRSFELSFVLSIPAALGAGVLAAADAGVAAEPLAAAVALGSAAVVGYATIDALMRLVERVDFWAVCTGLGSLAIVGGVVLVM
jgi:undecaprenyl-diphosphatase